MLFSPTLGFLDPLGFFSGFSLLEADVADVVRLDCLGFGDFEAELAVCLAFFCISFGLSSCILLPEVDRFLRSRPVVWVGGCAVWLIVLFSFVATRGKWTIKAGCVCSSDISGCSDVFLPA